MRVPRRRFRRQRAPCTRWSPRWSHHRRRDRKPRWRGPSRPSPSSRRPRRHSATSACRCPRSRLPQPWPPPRRRRPRSWCRRPSLSRRMRFRLQKRPPSGRRRWRQRLQRHRWPACRAKLRRRARRRFGLPRDVGHLLHLLRLRLSSLRVLQVRRSRSSPFRARTPATPQALPNWTCFRAPRTP